MRILGYHISGKVIANSDGEYRDKSPYINFLLCKKPSTIRVFYNMEDAVPRLMCLLNWGNGQFKELLETTKLCVLPYHFRYVPDKFFSIKKPKAFAYYGDAGRYIEPLELEPLQSANVAKEVGSVVYEALSSLGVKPINILNPYRQYESQVLKLSEDSIDKHLAILRYKLSCSNGIAKTVLSEIISGAEASYKLVV
jgi:hypothetical protein